MNFFRITSSCDKYIIEWSSDDGDNLRVKRKEKDKWIYGKTQKAKYAEMIGRQLLLRKEKENETNFCLSSMQEHFTFQS